MKFLSALCISLLVSTTIFGQDYELMTSMETYDALKKLHRGLRVMYLAAHPDDENTRLIAWLENEKDIETSYLSLTRGQGGQNLIGDEKGDALGVIRTYELLEARKIDGGEQMFTRAVDFGYSKSATESFKKWGREEVLADVVYAIRKFRPHVIVTRFPPNRYAGHGHHEASAILAEEAFDLVGDKTAFAEQFDRVEPWTVDALYFNTSSWWRKELSDKTDEELKAEQIRRVNIGVYDPTSGLSMNEIASLARSKHRCQAFGTSRDRGERFEYLQLIKGEWQDDLFDGYVGLWQRSPEHQQAIGRVIEGYDFTDPEANYRLFVEQVEPKLAQRSMWADAKDINYVTNLSNRIKQNLLGVRVEASAGQDPIVVGTEYEIQIEVFNGGMESVRLRFGQATIDTAFDLAAGIEVEFSRMLNAPTKVSNPYWLRQPHENLYVIEDLNWAAEPRLKSDLISYSIKRDVPIQGETELHRKWVDRSIGEVYQPLRFVPKVSVSNTSKTLIIPIGSSADPSLTVEAFDNISNVGLRFLGENSVLAPIPDLAAGQKSSHEGHMDAGGDKDNEFLMTSTVQVGEEVFDQTITTLEYDHIPEVQMSKPCVMRMVTMKLDFEVGTILYVEGSGDEVDESLENIGYEIDRRPLAEVSGDLDQYKAIVIGIRAYNKNEELLAYQGKLMEYVKNGGNMIVQYNTSRGLKTDNFAPYPLTLGRERVTEEDAPATLLQPKHKLFNKPNKVEPSDFDGWVQERGLYFASEWSEEFTPLISWKDSGEDEASLGGLLLAKHGKGSFFYSGISFFRQLPAGVPGAYRLLVNMIEYK